LKTLQLYYTTYLEQKLGGGGDKGANIDLTGKFIVKNRVKGKNGIRGSKKNLEGILLDPPVQPQQQPFLGGRGSGKCH